MLYYIPLCYIQGEDLGGGATNARLPFLISSQAIFAWLKIQTLNMLTTKKIDDYIKRELEGKERVSRRYSN